MELARAALAEKAVVAYGRGVAGQFAGDAVQVFRALDAAIRRRLTGDRRAERVLFAFDQRPLDDQSRQALASELRYYSEVDPNFTESLNAVLQRLDVLIDEKE